MSSHASRLAALVAVALLVAGCCCPPCPAPCAADGGGELVDPLGVVADEWIARATAAEPEVTALMRRLADEAGGELAGLKNRLKSRPAIVSKLDRMGDAVFTSTNLEVYDALRYTLLVDDEPAGHHDASIEKTLAELEAAGHTVEEVKNYWPRGDSYNGVNSIVRTPDGMPWELQFHTSASWAMKGMTHDDYELMRKPTAPAPERRRLFEKMVKMVDRLRIPEGILEPKSLHAAEELLLRPAPGR